MPGEVPLEDTKIGTVDTFAELQEMMRWLGESRGRTVLAVDTETMDLDSYAPDARVRLFQIGTENEAWVINAEKYPGICQEILETYNDTDIAFHNIAFDARYMQVVWPDLKFPWHIAHDTMLMCRIHDNEAPAGLKAVSDRLFGPQATAGQRALEMTMKNGGWSWATVPMSAPAYRIYSGVDVLLTARLFRRMEHVHSGEFKAVYDLERETRRIGTQMELRGIRVDRPYCEERRAALALKIDASKLKCREEYGVEIGSTMQLSKWFTEQGESLPDRTPTGLPMMGAEQLEKLAKKYELAEIALACRKDDKLRGTYYANVLKFSGHDGRVHAQINTLEAETGRQSVSNPSLQNFPSRGPGAESRKAFLASEGHRIYSADYSSLESRLAAHFARDEPMRETFRVVDQEGGDFFTELCKGLFGPEFTKADSRRGLVKTTMYASLYGGGLEKMAEAAEVPLEVMRAVAEPMFARYSAIKGSQKMFMDIATRNVRRYGRPFVTTPLGRRLYVNPRMMFTASNRAIQGHGAELLKQAMVNIDHGPLGDFLVLTVHDEMLLDVPNDFDPREVYEEMRSAMEVTQDMGYFVPIPISPVGPHERWGMGK